jgi:hypothetical protein
MLYAICSDRGREFCKRFKTEEGKFHDQDQRSANDMINEAHRRRRDRNRRSRERDFQPNAVTQGDVTGSQPEDYRAYSQVSPMSISFDRVHIPKGRTYDDVSPLSSPTELVGHGQFR